MPRPSIPTPAALRRAAALAACALSLASGVQLPVPLRVAHALPLDALSDDFESPGLSARWRVHNASLAQAWVAGGELHLLPTSGGGAVIWFQDSEGALLHKRVAGDFTAETSLRAFDPGDPAQPPPPGFRLGGLLARDPRSAPGDRNSVHVALGAGDGAVPIAAEDKSTRASSSDWLLHPISQAAGRLRLRRRGDVFSMHYRAPGASSWQLLRSHVRPDLPYTLEVGAMAYSNASPPTLEVALEDVTFTR